VERVDPRAVFGRPWPDLERAEQVELLGYATLREAEDQAEQRAMFEGLKVGKGQRGRK